MFFLSLCCQSAFPAGSHSPPHFPRMPSIAALVSGPAVGAAQILTCSYCSVFLPPVSPAVRASASSPVWLSVALYIVPRHRVCLVDGLDLIYSLHSRWEGFGSAGLAGTLAVPSVQGHGLSLPQALWPYQSLSSSLLELAISRPPWPVFLHSSAVRDLEGFLAWGPSLLFGASGT